MTDPFTALGPVAIVRLDHPPVNAFSLVLRQRTRTALAAAVASPHIQAIVLTGSGALFSAGADIREFDLPARTASPTLRELASIIEDCPKPVVAAIHGQALGGGLEIALACHYRVATPDAQVALPEVRLGWLPGVGGTQRLPRLLGVHTALSMIVHGTRRRADSFAPGTLFDALAGHNLLDVAAERGLRAAASPSPCPRVRDRVPPDADQARTLCDQARRQSRWEQPVFDAPIACINAVEAAATRPFEEGLRQERESLAALGRRVESRALRHLFYARRDAVRLHGVTAVVPRQVAMFTWIPAARDLARMLQAAGVPIQQDLSSLGDLRADLVICDTTSRAAFPEGTSICMLGKPTDLVRLLSASTEPQLVGLHAFTGRAEPCCEVVTGPRTSGAAVAAAFALCRLWGRTAISVRAQNGLVAECLQARAREEAGAMLDDSIAPQRVADAFYLLGCEAGITLPPPSRSPRVTEAGEVARRLTRALAHTGQDLVRREVARSNGEVDLLAVAALGFRSYLGGPMFAQEAGMVCSHVQERQL